MKKLVAIIHGEIEWTDQEFKSPYSYYLYEGGFFKKRSCKFLGPYDHLKKQI